ncbi:DUF362 domain-containing protein [candidate division KSB3 bacterium]|uniref:DUF362 domain-containing protein n=1 Tax=candidate division KSB3 bacterium TaxID=2044937 RepID=A0A9D5JTD3_9BACT|nr:DUF362 domain-containing protein [candidate division KSB3 bacterium]MBD3323904.1 DUF362 domain-containing protein [candidate division KSB3 bacterium]
MSGSGSGFPDHRADFMSCYQEGGMTMPLTHKSITRRNFLQGTVGATLAASVLGLPGTASTAAAARSSLVTVVRDQQVMDSAFNVDETVLQTMLDQAILQVTGKPGVKEAWASLVQPNDIVGLVPSPHLNPTHDEVVAVVKNALMQEAGIPAEQIVMAQGLRRPERCTALICMPALKGHWLTGIGTVIKNYILYSGHPSRYHQENSAKLGEIWLLPEVKGKTRLVLVDALHPLCDKGPQPDPRYQWAYKGLIAGTDPVAVETVGLRILTEKRHALRGEPWPLSPPPICVEAADTVYGLGTSNLDEITIVPLGWQDDLLV